MRKYSFFATKKSYCIKIRHYISIINFFNINLKYQEYGTTIFVDFINDFRMY